MSDERPSHWQDLPNAPAPGTELLHLDTLADGGVQFLEFGPSASIFRLLLLRSGETVFAYVNRCAHFGVPLAQRVDQLHFKPHLSVSCNVHYARFRWQDGLCEFGDCVGESLLPIPVANCDGVICIGEPKAGP